MQCRVPRSVILRLVAEFLGCPYHPNFLPRVRPRKVLAKAHARQEYRDWREPQAEHHHNEFCADGLLIIRLWRSVRDAIHCFSAGQEALAVFIQGRVGDGLSPDRYGLLVHLVRERRAPQRGTTFGEDVVCMQRMFCRCFAMTIGLCEQFGNRVCCDGRYSPGGGRWSRR